jgi:hypothetical protein
VGGETDLGVMLRGLSVTVRPGRYTVTQAEGPVALGDGVEVVLAEGEGTTVVATVEAAERHGWPVGFVAAWLTLDVHSALEAVGLTAAVATALADEAIPANVLAGYLHDHLLIPADRADDAVACLTRLRQSPTAP